MTTLTRNGLHLSKHLGRAINLPMLIRILVANELDEV